MYKILQVVLLLLLLLSIILFTINGCSIFHASKAIEQPPIELTPGQQLTKIVQSTNWLVTLSIIGVGAGFFSFLNGNGNGIRIMGACFIVISLVLMVAKYAAWIAFLTMAGAVVLLGYTIIIKTKAIKEIIAGVQRVKDINVAIDDRKIVNETLQNTQSASTQAVVKDVKNK